MPRPTNSAEKIKRYRRPSDKIFRLISSLSKNEKRYFKGQEKLDDAKNRHQIDTYKHASTYLKLRAKYVKKLRHMTAWWLTAVIATLFLEGFNFFGFHLSNSVLIAFITSTTASVLGLFVLVTRWLFVGQLSEIRFDKASTSTDNKG